MPRPPAAASGFGEHLSPRLAGLIKGTANHYSISGPLKEALVLDASPSRYGGRWLGLGVGRLFGGADPENA